MEEIIIMLVMCGEEIIKIMLVMCYGGDYQYYAGYVLWRGLLLCLLCVMEGIINIMLVMCYGGDY